MCVNLVGVRGQAFAANAERKRSRRRWRFGRAAGAAGEASGEQEQGYVNKLAGPARWSHGAVGAEGER